VAVVEEEEAAPVEDVTVPAQPAPQQTAQPMDIAPTDPVNPQPAAPKDPAPVVNPPKDLKGVFIPEATPYIQLNWDPNNTVKIDYFNIYRMVVGEAEQGNVPPIGKSKKPAFEDKDIKPGLTYRYWVTAVARSGGESSPSNTVDVKTYADVKPVAPQGVTAVAIDPGVSFDWAVSGDGNLAGYNIYEPKGASGKWNKVNAAPVTDNHYYYPGGAVGITYAVSAVNFYGRESEYVKVLAVASAPVIYEESDAAVSVEGLWAAESYVGPANGKIRVAGDAGSRLHFKFKGSQVKMVCATYWTCGSANVYLDGALISTINLYSYDTSYNVIKVNAPGIKAGEHVLTVEVLGSGNPEGTYNFVNVDAFEVR
jgi:hypothetical protein